MKFRAIVTAGVIVLGFAPHVAAQSLAAPASAAEPLTGLVLGLGLLGLRFLRRH